MGDFVLMNKKVPKKAVENICKYYDKKSSWSLNLIDINIDKWNFLKNSSEKVLEELKSYEQMNWYEIISKYSGRKNGTDNHFVPIINLSKEAINELKKLKYLSENLSTLFSLRLNNLTRLYGIIDEITGTFRIVWFDNEHKIYSMN